MIILGIDPGTTTTGFGVIEIQDPPTGEAGKQLILRDYGVITTKPKIPLAEKLAEIYKDITQIIDNVKPDQIAIEQIFFFKNTKTAMSVGQARGVILLAAQNAKLQITEFTPLQVKAAICSNGRAEKKQIQEMVKNILNLKETPKPDDAADALAIAICCHHYQKYQ